MITPPHNSTEVKAIDWRVCIWCYKCHRNEGLWVSHHTADTHVDNYRAQRHRQKNSNHRVHFPAAVTQIRTWNLNPRTPQPRSLPFLKHNYHCLVILMGIFPGSPNMMTTLHLLMLRDMIICWCWGTWKNKRYSLNFLSVCGVFSCIVASFSLSGMRWYGIRYVIVPTTFVQEESSTACSLWWWFHFV